MPRLSAVRCKVLAVRRRGVGACFCRNGKGLYGSAAVETSVKSIAVGQVVTLKAIPSQRRLPCQRVGEGHTRSGYSNVPQDASEGRIAARDGHTKTIVAGLHTGPWRRSSHGAAERLRPNTDVRIWFCPTVDLLAAGLAGLARGLCLPLARATPMPTPSDETTGG
jgi:hypothetical protein